MCALGAGACNKAPSDLREWRASDHDQPENPAQEGQVDGTNTLSSLGIDEVTLALVADGKGFRVGKDGTWTVEPRIVDRAIERIDPVTMRGVGCGHPLFGSAARNIRSEVLVILEADAPLPYGLLLLGQSKEAVIDGKPYREFWGELARTASDAGPLASPRYRLLLPEDEAEVERLYQRLKAVRHLDPDNSGDEE